ncbi:DUF2087 domain-containing protein [Neobacillus sp. YIM B06451]|uniref:DUF2087 domain-containing protein n=1 Tax=Neobacillus sp. YIM B06451 TaxID=3070994 RepID=UPI00292F6C20|nr:DUF2087 domain-containing protein [Neobacillus sp. YIM B06451]
MNDEERFWNASVEELSNGYILSNDEYVCLLCSESFIDGIIYPIDGTLYEAKKAIVRHIQDIHISVFDYLLNLDKKYTGLSEHQKELLHYFKKGLSDKEILKELNGGSPSTIRNHRFKLKEKEKQAKVFIAVMNLLSKGPVKQIEDDFVSFHKGAKMVDERYATTEEERQKVLSNYFKQGVDGRLDTFPSKEKRKLIVLQNIIKRFDRNKVYTESEINAILKEVFSDFATIRRYFIEYGFMDRSKDCTQYWIKN